MNLLNLGTKSEMKSDVGQEDNSADYSWFEGVGSCRILKHMRGF